MGHKPPRRSRTRAERHTQIIEARARGESLADTAARLGISRSYYHELLNDPTGAKVEARRRRYQKPCPTCGKPMTGSNGHTGAPKLCARCDTTERTANRVWTHEAIIEAIKAFATQYGRPPVSTEWNPACSTKHRREADWAIKREGWPCTPTVIRRFGSWATAIDAAGFPRPHVGHKPRGYVATPGASRRARTFDYAEALRRFEDGEPTRALAARYGVWQTNIHRALRIARNERKQEDAA